MPINHTAIDMCLHIDLISAFGAEHDVAWSEPGYYRPDELAESAVDE